MTIFDKQLPGFRYAQTNFGDSLQAFALRELGDASQWSRIARINGLMPPYLTDDKSQVVPGVVLTGSLLLVPAATASASAATDPSLVFLTDVALSNGRITAANGDIAMVTGTDNLKQAMNNRVETLPGDLLYHEDYGCKIGLLKGLKAGPNTSLLGAKYVSDALQQDNRIQQVLQSIVSVAGDTTSVEIEVQPVVGKTVSTSATV